MGTPSALRAMNDQPTPPHVAGHQAAQGPLPQGLGAQASEQVRALIEAAERTAAAIIKDAEAQAQTYLEEARAHTDRAVAQRSQQMSALTGDLIERTEAVKRQSNELLQVLDETRRRLDDGSKPAAAPVQATPAEQEKEARPWGAEQPVQPRPAEQPRPAAEDAPLQRLKAAEAQLGKESPGNGPSDGARLLTTQMAVAGSSRAEIESRLQNEFGISDTGPMLDAILGREE